MAKCGDDRSINLGKARKLTMVPGALRGVDSREAFVKLGREFVETIGSGVRAGAQRLTALFEPRAPRL